MVLVLVGLAGMLGTSLLGNDPAPSSDTNKVSGAASATNSAASKTNGGNSPSLSQQIIGVWEGTWNTTRGEGDSGPLKCTLTGLTNGTYNARFRATYKKILPFVTSVDLHAVQKDGFIEVSGSTKLADWAGGNYVYHGKIKGDSFVCTYTSDKDTGLFEMTRSK
jgi:hypothetical protein